jgi:hypothetical protein
MVLNTVNQFGDPTALIDIVILVFEIFYAGEVIFELVALFGLSNSTFLGLS